MKCSFCGNEIEKDVKFCPVCGTEVTEDGRADGKQQGLQNEEFDKRNENSGSGYMQGGYSQSDNNSGDYSYGRPESNFGGYSSGQPESNFGGYGGGQSGSNIGGYGQSESNSGSYGYGQSESNPGSYDYGQSESNPGSYGYGQSESNPGGYGYSQSENNPGGENYGQTGNAQGENIYGQENPYNQPNYGQPNNGFNQPIGSGPMNYSQSNYGQPAEQISGTPYLIFSILATICCCLPLGVASIVYASKINSLQRMGDYEGAKDAAKKAKIFCISSAVVGVIASIVMGAAGVFDVLEDLGYSSSGSSFVSDSLGEDREDQDKENKEEQEEDEEDKASSAPVKASEDLGDSWKSYTVQINDVVVTFPCSIAEVEASGLKMDTENTPEDYVINKDDYELVFFDDDNLHSLMFVISNNTEEAHVVRECTVNGVYVNDYDVEGGDLTVVFPGDIRIGTDIETVFEKWGEPDDVYEGDYADSYHWYDEDSFNYCTVSTEPGEDKVITIDLDGQYLK